MFILTCIRLCQVKMIGLFKPIEKGNLQESTGSNSLMEHLSLASQTHFSPRAHAHLIIGWRREGKIRLVTIDRISFLAARNLCGRIRAQQSCDNNTCCVTRFTFTLRIIVDRKTQTQRTVEDKRRCNNKLKRLLVQQLQHLATHS